MMQRKNLIGACVMAGAILLSIPLGAHTSLGKLREKAADSYYYDRTGYAIYEGLGERVATARNMATVAERYTGENPELVALMDEVDYAADLVEYSGYQEYAQEAQANRQLGEAAQALYEGLKATQLSQTDEKYPDQLMAQLESEQDKISRSSYNEDARNFNARLEKFPANLLRHVAGVEPLATFDSA